MKERKIEEQTEKHEDRGTGSIVGIEGREE